MLKLHVYVYFIEQSAVCVVRRQFLLHVQRYVYLQSQLHMQNRASVSIALLS